MANLKDLIINGVARFVGKAYAQTPATDSNDNQIATTAYVKAAIESAIANLNNTGK